MKVTFFGHNCYVLQGKNVVVLTDPWLTNNGAFFGSWFQWPINHHYKDTLKEQLETKRNTILYISHEHQDHFDKETLAEIQPLIDLCIIPEYDDKFLRNELSAMGYKIHELCDQTKYSLSQTDYIELMIVDTGVNHDSAALFKIDDETFLNQNDCKIFDRLNYLKGESIDYYAVQFSGATWHPVCYELDEDEKRKISKKKVLSKLVAVRNAINLIQPKFYLPSAGPAIFPFLDKTLSLGIDNIFVHQPDLDKFLKNTDTKLSYLRPGDTLNPLSITQPIEPPTEQELSILERTLVCEFECLSDQNFETEQLVKQIKNRLEQIKDIKLSQCPKLLLDWNEQGLEIDLNYGIVQLINWADYEFPDSYMKVSASKSYFYLMSDPLYRWQDIYLSLRASVHRVPDVFNTFLNIFLFSDASNIRSAFVSTLDIKDERILIVNPLDGKNYEINRYCPHNGADLKDARIDQDGNLVCPRHSWLFSLSNNGICEKADVSIDAREVIETISLCESVSARLLKADE